MIVPQKSTQPIATSHGLVAVGFRNLAEKQHVVLTLVISLSMIVRQIVVHRPPQGSFAAIESLMGISVAENVTHKLGRRSEREKCSGSCKSCVIV